MKKIILLILLPLLSIGWCRADINTERTISKIVRDTKTYLSAEGRAETEQKAYEMAMNELTSRVADYYKNEFPSQPLPDAVYLSNLSRIFDRLTTQVSSNRYRVMVYVRKSDVKALGDNRGTVLARNDAGGYEILPTTPSCTDTVTIETVKTVIKPLNPTISAIRELKTRGDVLKQMPELKKANKIMAAAAFPIHALNDFYIIILAPSDDVVSVLHSDGKEYTDIMSGEAVDINIFNFCSAYWFTLPE